MAALIDGGRGGQGEGGLGKGQGAAGEFGWDLGNCRGAAGGCEPAING